ncbi:P-loop containing nucleoside triphosphate hydrolases superfamily protein [Wolffia australiana]
MGAVPDEVSENLAGGEEEQRSFEDLGLEPRLIRALLKKNIEKPTLIQQAAIPFILQGKDVFARAHTGSGKTFVYLLPMFHSLFADSDQKKSGPRALILAPSRELCQQVYSEALSLLEHCRVQIKVTKLTKDMAVKDLTAALVEHPEVVVSTPACILSCISRGALQAKDLQGSLSMLVLDEADFLFDFQQGNDLKALVPHIPRRCQCLLLSATSSDDVEEWRKLVLHNPVSVTLTNDDNKDSDDIIPKSIQQFWISCSHSDKLLHVLALLKLGLVQKKVLIFVNSIDAGYRLKLFLEQFGLHSAVLNAELPQNSRLHILKEFNAGLFDYLIATDDSKIKEDRNVKSHQAQSNKSKRPKRKADSEFGVVRGVDFKNVFTVINFDMPESSSGYVHRVGRTGRANSAGSSVSLVSPEELDVFDDIKAMLGDEEEESGKPLLCDFPFLTKGAVESLRYRAEDVAKGVTKVAIREARAEDLRTEIINSDKLKAHFDNNPKDLDILKHDKVLSKKPPLPHLREVPDYLQDSTAKQASEAIKLSRAAMDLKKPSIRRQRFKKRLSKNKDPLSMGPSQGKKSGRVWTKRKAVGSEGKTKKARQE